MKKYLKLLLFIFLWCIPYSVFSQQIENYTNADSEYLINKVLKLENEYKKMADEFKSKDTFLINVQKEMSSIKTNIKQIENKYDKNKIKNIWKTLDKKTLTNINKYELYIRYQLFCEMAKDKEKIKKLKLLFFHFPKEKLKNNYKVIGETKEIRWKKLIQKFKFEESSNSRKIRELKKTNIPNLFKKIIEESKWNNYTILRLFGETQKEYISNNFHDLKKEINLIYRILYQKNKYINWKKIKHDKKNKK